MDPELRSNHQLLAGLNLIVGQIIKLLNLFNSETLKFLRDVPQGVTALNDIHF